MSTQAEQDYLKAIYELAASGGEVTTTTLARHLDVTPASVTNMLKKLARAGLVTHTPYRGATLTAKGERVAVKTLRAHRVVERFLVEALNLPWDEVHHEADRWEHVVSEQVILQMEETLGYPTTDPHGAPIPTRQGDLPIREADSLWEADAPTRLRVLEIEDEDPELLRYAAGLGLIPGTEIELLRRQPYDELLFVQIGDREIALGEKAARRILVTRIAEGEG